MKRFVKLLSFLVVLIFVVMGLGYYMLKPEAKINEDDKLKYEVGEINAEKILNNKFIENASLSTSGLTGKVEIDNSLFKELLKQNIDKINGDDELMDSSFKIEGSKIVVKKPFKIADLIDSEIDMNLKVENDDNDIKVIVEDVRLGKIHVPEKVVNEFIKENIKTIEKVKSNDNIIYYSGIDEDMVKLKNVRIKDSKIVIDYTIPISLRNILGKYGNIINMK